MEALAILEADFEIQLFTILSTIEVVQYEKISV